MYQKEKDVILTEKEIVGDELVVRLCQYDGGEKKIAIMKKIETKHGITYTGKIGRLDITTASVLAQKITELCNGN